MPATIPTARPIPAEINVINSIKIGFLSRVMGLKDKFNVLEPWADTMNMVATTPPKSPCSPNKLQDIDDRIGPSLAFYF